MKDLIVCDEEYAALAKKYKELGEVFDKYYSNFVHTVYRVTKHAITSGETHNNIVCLLSSLKELKCKLSNSTELASKICEQFVYNIDEADSNLF